LLHIRDVSNNALSLSAISSVSRLPQASENMLVFSKSSLQ
jgi:hypothetical protein